MLFSNLLVQLVLGFSGALASAVPDASDKLFPRAVKAPEAGAWYGIPNFNVLAKNYTLPGLSPLYPAVHCTAKGHVCQFTLGESEINAANSVMALILNPMFDLTKTYFLIAGIAGVNPEVATMGSVTFARYAVQVALQYEFDARQIPANFSTGYIPQGSTDPTEYPQSIYGTEVFEVNTALRKLAIGYAKTAKLADNAASKKYRANYASTPAYAAGAKPPSVVACDVATSDVYFSGTLLGEAFTNYTKLVTNGTGVYCATAQEDNATLEVMLRGAVYKLVDFGRIIVMRTCSDFDRPYAGESGIDNLFYGGVGFEPSIENIYNAGIKVVEGILGNWDKMFAKGIKADNYIGDIFNTLGGTPDFGLPAQYINNNPVNPPAKRERKRPVMLV